MYACMSYMYRYVYVYVCIYIYIYMCPSTAGLIINLNPGGPLVQVATSTKTFHACLGPAIQQQKRF